ncbi:barstar family protein [Romboutsia lituseburensis]|uniref:Barstar (Barnase inhibitor) n=1 Tax=Romboutsia lituseburensis DSM 797 TaxID=1121325 RepID=A0A1G9PNM0_9FIRM|nr:barstar family protein [Romboutsia lituseburensis]CEH33439.1 Barstar (barnase inhibitor) [Romboutsia lituseburensis]SDL99665.1 Barstar (barnase inhibitor) [Romboutsia lituseburensis DSM 797]
MHRKLIEKNYIYICKYFEWEEKIKEEIINNSNDVLVVEIECENCKDKQSLMVEIANKLNFPSYFSYNWDSLDECLNDLEWIEFSSLIIVLRDTEYLLANEIYNLGYFYDIISDSLIEWNEGRNCNDYKTLSKIYCVLSTVENLNLLEKELKKCDIQKYI